MSNGAEPKELSLAAVVTQLETLGVRRGGVLLIHSSFRAVRPIEGGPLGLIAALRETLGPDGTLVMPSMSDNDDVPFDPATGASAPDLGIVPAMFWRMSDVARSNHPFAFAAVGPHAADITADPLPIPPHCAASPVGRVHDLDGQVLLLGCGYDACTVLHLAELLAGVPYRAPRHCTVLKDDRPVRIDYGENDHCCQRFALAEHWLQLRGQQQEGPVGHARARLARARDIVTVALEQLAKDPLLFLCPSNTGCEECDEVRAGATSWAALARRSISPHAPSWRPQSIPAIR